MKHHLETLGLAEGASQEEIQLAFERLSKQLNPAENDNQEFFKEEYEKVQVAYNALNQSSILKNSESSFTTVRPSKTESSVSPQSSGEFTVTISKEKIEELKHRTPSSEQKPHVKPSMFRNPFSFKGRIRRLEYGLSFIIFYFLNNFFIFLTAEMPIFFFFLLGSLWFSLVQGAKRCHDRGNSGWYQIIPFYGFWMLFADGDIGNNSYGPNPKGINKIN